MWELRKAERTFLCDVVAKELAALSQAQSLV